MWRRGQEPLFPPRTRGAGGDAGLSPADWREYDGRAPRRRGQAEALDHLLGQVKTVHQHCVCHGECLAWHCREAGVGDPARPPRVVTWSRGCGGIRSRSVPWMSVEGRQLRQWRLWQSLPTRLVCHATGCRHGPSSPAAASSALCSPEPCKNQPQSRKHSVSKSLKHLFHPGSKFLKTLKR